MVATLSFETPVTICESIKHNINTAVKTLNPATLGIVPRRFFANSIGLLSRFNYSPFINLSVSHIHIKLFPSFVAMFNNTASAHSI
jgi:hypothetical protein